ncbi:hypothetical protein PM082_013361 [Marasmius tenuissimus]|nr:hypothetical protein PM082_013361 [Marasmius tenuissimus]
MVRTRKGLESENLETSPQRTISELRTDKLLDSGLSGFVTGGIIRGLTAGPRVALPAGVTVGTACTVLQLLFNQVKISRLQYLSGNVAHTQGGSSTSPSNPTTNSSNTNTTSTPSEANWTTSLLKFFGIRLLTDEEYLEKLRAQRNGYLERIAELESRIDSEKKEKDA